MQQKMRRCLIKGDFQCPSWCDFQSIEQISQKINQKLYENYFFEFFS